MLSLIKILSERRLFESWRGISTNIDFLLMGKGGKTFLLTSTVPGEGKTISAVNIAIAMAHMGKKTLLMDMDMDMERASIHKVFNISREPGFMDLALRNIELKDAIKGISDFVISGVMKQEDLTRIPGIDNLYVLGSGHSPPNPIQIISSINTKELIDRLKAEFDILIFDCTPTLAAATTSVLASILDWVILVYEVGKVARGSLRRAVTQLTHAKANVLGVILNKMRAEDFEPGVSYYYKYRYYEEEKKHSSLGIFKRAKRTKSK